MKKINLSDFHPATRAAENGDNPQGAADALVRAFVRAQRLDGGEGSPEPLHVSINGISSMGGVFVRDALGGLAKRMRADHGVEVTPENLVITCTEQFDNLLIGSAWFYIKQELVRRALPEGADFAELSRKTVEIEEDARKRLRRSFTAFLARLTGGKKKADDTSIYKKMVEIADGIAESINARA